MANSNNCFTALNLDGSQCVVNPADIVKVAFIKPTNDGGTANKFANLAAITQTAILAMINETDWTKRLFPFPNGLKDVSIETPDSDVKTYTDKSKTEIRAGVNEVTFVAPLKDPALKGKIKNFAKLDALSVYFWDKLGNMFTYTKKSDPLAYFPIPIDAGSVTAKNVARSADDVMHTQVSFNYDSATDDAQIVIIPAEKMDLTVSDFVPLNTIVVDFSNITTAGGTLNLRNNVNPAISSGMPSGLLTASFSYYEKATGSAVSGVTTTASTTVDGEYTFAGTFTAATEYYVEISQLDGYDFSLVPETTFATP